MIVAGRDVRARLGDIRCPALIITSRQDHVINPADSDILAEGIAGPVERIWLEDSYHVATLDYDGPEVKAATVEIGRHTSELQSLMRISYAVFCLKKKKKTKHVTITNICTET